MSGYHIFEEASGVSVVSLHNACSKLFIAATVLLSLFIIFSLIKRIHQGNFKNIVETIMESMFVGILIGLTLFIAS